jgi:hypothetical protein
MQSGGVPSSQMRLQEASNVVDWDQAIEVLVAFLMKLVISRPTGFAG